MWRKRREREWALQCHHFRGRRHRHSDGFWAGLLLPRWSRRRATWEIFHNLEPLLGPVELLRMHSLPSQQHFSRIFPRVCKARQGTHGCVSQQPLPSEYNWFVATFQSRRTKKTSPNLSGIQHNVFLLCHHNPYNLQTRLWNGTDLMIDAQYSIMEYSSTNYQFDHIWKKKWGTFPHTSKQMK